MSRFAAGDTVRIKDWGEMVAAYTLDNGEIYIGENRPWFTTPMRRFCGTVCTVARIEMVGRYELVRIEPIEDDDGSLAFWNFCDEMLILVDPDTTSEIPESDFDLLIGVM